MLESTTLSTCPICKTANFDQPENEYSVAPWVLKTCAACSMVYLENPPAYEDLKEELAWERTFAEESKARRKRNPLLYKLGRMPKAVVQKLFKRDKLLALTRKYIAPGRVLDVGCGWGHTLESFPPEYIPCGIEISAELSAVAQARFAPRGGFCVSADGLSGLRSLDAAMFSGIIMTSYLEHEVHVGEVLVETARVMQLGARLIVKVPNYASWNRGLRGAKWCGFRYPDHVNYFTPELLQRLMRQSGFRVVQFGLSDRMPSSDTMWMVAEVASLR